MGRVFVTYYFLILGLNVSAQPPLNQWYDFGRNQSVIGSVVATDSCYYVSGAAPSIVVPGIVDALFAKIDFDGNVVFQKFLHSDTCWINTYGWTNLLSTSDGNFVALADYDEFFLLIKYSPNGDTLFTTTIKDFYLDLGHLSIRPSTIIEIESDSSFTCIATVQNEISLECHVVLFNISKTGQLNFYEIYNISQPGYLITYGVGLVKLPDGYMISCDIGKDFGGSVDDEQHSRLIKTDILGIEQFRWTDWANESTLFPAGLTLTPDGGYLYGGMTGWYTSVYNAQHYLGHIVKLDSNLDLEWEIQMGDTTGINEIRVMQILDIGNNKYVATGFCQNDTMKIGWMINFNLAGDVIWDSYFSYVPQTSPEQPEHELYDIKQTPDNGFVMVGEAWDVQATSGGTPAKFGWLLKTDSVGCLVPGCQDFLDVENNLQPTIKLSTFPNPASNVINIYYFDPEFSGKAEMMIFDINGNKIKSWNLFSNDMTYIYDVSNLSVGTYIIKFVDSGIEKHAEKFVKI